MKLDDLITDAKLCGLRMTPAKKKLLDIFIRHPSPVSAGEILQILEINKTTVYRALETLISKRIITEVDFGDGKKRYELESKNHHHHLICTKCARVQEFPVEDQLESVEKLISRETSFKVQRHTLEFFGTCGSCS